MLRVALPSIWNTNLAMHCLAQGPGCLVFVIESLGSGALSRAFLRLQHPRYSGITGFQTGCGRMLFLNTRATNAIHLVSNTTTIV